MLNGVTVYGVESRMAKMGSCAIERDLEKTATIPCDMCIKVSLKCSQHFRYLLIMQLQRLVFQPYGP
jgi:hypothetical protein